VTDRTADDEARWAAALTSLEHGPTPALRARARRRFRLVLGIGAVALLVAVLVPLLLLLPLPDRPDRPDRVGATSALDVTALVVMSGSVLVQVAALVLLFRANRGRWVSPLAALTQRQNRQLRDHVRGKGPLRAELVPLARHLAESALRQRPVVLVLLGALLLWVGMALGTPSWWRTAFAVTFACLVLAGWLHVRREERTARRFLDQHPASERPA
jgi:hypothetical protein